MKKTVFITGASKGIGKECAIKYLENGWNVVATMRTPENDKELSQYDNALILKLDVTDNDSVLAAIDKAINTFGQIDVLINNAGYYSIGVVEAISDEEITREINTNLTGLIRVTKAVLPYMRYKKSGLIINLSSVAGRSVVPIQSLYHATKWGVEGFSRSLQFEVSDLGIDVVLIEPGVIKTDFYGDSMSLSVEEDAKEYKQISDGVSKYLIENGNNGSKPEEVAEKIYAISISQKRKMQYTVGKSTEIVMLYKMLPDFLYQKIVKKIMMK